MCACKVCVCLCVCEVGVGVLCCVMLHIGEIFGDMNFWDEPIKLFS